MAKSTEISKRYPIFINFFEKFVSKKQEEINQLREMESLYIIAKEALDNNEYDNNIKIDSHDNSIDIRGMLTYENHYKDFNPLIKTITELLYKKNLRKYEEPSFSKNESHTVYWRWSIVKNKGKEKEVFYVNFYMTIPFEGTRYCKITSQKVTYTSTEYKATWVDK